ncbi:hypothetical protein BGZ54_008373, partial [Gamsiella multidivaricata]
MIVGGANILAGIISQTGTIPKGGFSAILFDMGYACTPGFDPNNTLPPPEFYGLPRIALIRRGGPTSDDACTFRTKLLNAQANSSIAAVVYNNPGSTALDGATAALNSSESPLSIPGMLISYDDGMMLRTLLQQTQDSGSVDFYNRVRITMSVDQKLPVVWEFVLIVVVVLLAVSFTVSVVLHCRLYALRQRIRMDALARGADVLPNGTIRMRKLTMDKAALDKLPVRIYGQDHNASSSEEEALTTTEAAVAPVGTVSSASATEETTDETHRNAGSGSGTGLDKQNDTAENTGNGSSSTSPSRANSLKGSISGKSTRSLGAVAAATALDASCSTTQQTQPTSTLAATNNPTPVLDEVTSDTCAVCLDEFSDGEEIRMLPCRHEFHCECIDPWLVRKSSTCPLCKYDCLPRTVEEESGHGEDAPIVVPHDRFIEFVMGPEW